MELQYIFISSVLKESANISSCLNSRVADKTGWGLDLLIRLRPRTSSALIYKTSAPSFRKYQNTKRLNFLPFSGNNLASILKTHKDTRSSLQSPLSKNQTKLHGIPQFFNHIFLLMSRKYVCEANEKYVLDQQKSVL